MDLRPVFDRIVRSDPVLWVTRWAGRSCRLGGFGPLIWTQFLKFYEIFVGKILSALLAQIKELAVLKIIWVS